MDLYDKQKLTNREKQCLQLLASGHSSDEISDILSISKHTVNFHLKNSRNKLKARNRTHAVVLAITGDIITPGSFKSDYS